MEVRLLSGNRCKGESKNAVLACNDWLRLGLGRSLSSLFRQYIYLHNNPPTKSRDDLERWYCDFNWEDRAKELDDKWNAFLVAQRYVVFNTGFALSYHRIKVLQDIADLLIGQLFQKDHNDKYFNLWVSDVRISDNKDYERFDVLNRDLVNLIRGVLVDIARETGANTTGDKFRGRGEFSSAYNEWRIAVFDKYLYQCYCCESGSEIRAHHLYSWDAFPDLRFEIDNGICLCHCCHNEFHQKYGYGNNTLEQFLDFVNKSEL